MPPTVVSAPGKVLFAGGYIVLDPRYPALIVGSASRFYTAVQDQEEEEVKQNGSNGYHREDEVYITVKSPQFTDPEWIYAVNYGDTTCQVSQMDNGARRNPFVQYALEASLQISFALGKKVHRDLQVNIVGDNDFYSQKRPESNGTAYTNGKAQAQHEEEPFAFLDVSLKNVHKTGLGSSAAMVTSLAAAMLVHLQAVSVDIPSHNDLRLIHNVAQYAHSQAQGKVGSGFDVSSAIWGSHAYTRFSADYLDTIINTPDITPSALLEGLSPQSPAWQPEASTSGSVGPFSLPPLTTLLLADVDAGSNTPSMVSKVLKWRKTQPVEAESLWQDIASLNTQLNGQFQQLRRICRKDPKGYEDAIRALSSVRSSEWSTVNSSSCITSVLQEARCAIKSIRKSMKSMGENADVPIEPDEQTRLIDACTEQCVGVLGGGVPGAGGYDALWILVLSPDQAQSPAEEQVRSLFHGWKEMSVQPLSHKACLYTPASDASQQQQRGLAKHQLEEVDGLAAALSRR